MTPLSESVKAALCVEVERRGLQGDLARRGLRLPGEGRTVPSGGSGVTRDVPDGIPIGQRPQAPCAHDFMWLRSAESIRFENPDPNVTALVRSGTDTFFCRHCLEYREVKRP